MQGHLLFRKATEESAASKGVILRLEHVISVKRSPRQLSSREFHREEEGGLELITRTALA